MSAVQQVNPNAEVMKSASALFMNINAAKGLYEVMKTNLGPRGTIVRLVSGTIIVWDGQRCKHCTKEEADLVKSAGATGRIEADSKVYGTHFSLAVAAVQGSRAHAPADCQAAQSRMILSLGAER